MIKRHVLLFCFLCLLTATTAFHVDDDPFSDLIQKLEAFSRSRPHEKVYLQLDKPYYAIGDNIWFKAYVLNAGTSRLSSLSGVLNVDLINEDDSLVKSLKLPVSGGVTWGDFQLTDSLTEGNYRVRAYTGLMRNAGPAFFFDKVIKVGNTWANKVFVTASYNFDTGPAEPGQVTATLRFKSKEEQPFAAAEVNYQVSAEGKIIVRGKGKTNADGDLTVAFKRSLAEALSSGKITAELSLPDKQKVSKVIPIKTTSSDIDVQFFPEGGNLVESLPSKIALKAINAAGLGENVSGVIQDDEGNEITRFRTSYLGMGNFILNPMPGKTYTATVRFADGSEKPFPLPKVQTSGYVLSINNLDPDKITINTYVSASLVNNQELRLVGQHSGVVCFTSKAAAKTQVITSTLLRKDLPEGIMQITLFTADNVPACERLVFVHNDADRINTRVEARDSIYNKRSAVSLNVVSSADGQSTRGIYSVSVTNADVVKPDLDNESNILTTFLLTSDLAGYVEKPNHYFRDATVETRAELDNLLLTQGWRRFLWHDILKSSVQPAAFPAEKSLSISGTLTTLGGKPAPNGKVTLVSSGGGFFVLDTISDASGRFTFKNLVFPEGTKFTIQGRNADDKKNVEVKVDPRPGQVVTKSKNTADIDVNVNEAIWSYLKKSEMYFDEQTRSGLLQRTIGLKEVNITQKKNPVSTSSNLNGAGNADYIITAKDLETCLTVAQCLQGRIAGLVVKSGIPYLTRYGNTPMRITIDGMPAEAEFLENINVRDIETVEVLKSPSNTAIYGSRGGGGILVITTKTGKIEDSYTSYSPWIVAYAPKGFAESRLFYSPKYTTDIPDNKSDLRTTVYWNPQVVSDKDGKAAFDFFTTDQSGNYRVVVEGINGNGQLGRTVYNYQVK
jgi:TonB-dependent SusC/RagA subfamily outer membrane receptor